jgi:hypothetical protein
MNLFGCAATPCQLPKFRGIFFQVNLVDLSRVSRFCGTRRSPASASSQGAACKAEAYRPQAYGAGQSNAKGAKACLFLVQPSTLTLGSRGKFPFHSALGINSLRDVVHLSSDCAAAFRAAHWSRKEANSNADAETSGKGENVAQGAILTANSSP